MKRILLILLLPMFISAQISWNMNLLGSFDYENNHNTKCNDIWGWEDDNESEFALVGLENGFSCVDVTNPNNPIEMFYIQDAQSIWRDVKTWGNYAYVTTEADVGLLIVDLTDMTGNTYWHVKDFTNNTTGDSLHFEGAHNIYIDENGIAYIFGASNPNGFAQPPNSAIFLDVANNPTYPEYLGEWDDSLLTSQDNYIHDGMVRGDTMYAGCIYGGTMHIVDVSDKSNPQTIGQHPTPNNFTHNAWVSDDGDYVFTTDEQSGAYLAAYNISDINNIYEVDRIQSNPGSNSIPHNVHVDGNFLITSYYRDGTTVHDITYPNHMVQVAYYDSYSGSGNGFDGCWGTYPFLSSGNIISSDRNSYNNKGVLNIYGRAFQQACYLIGNVSDGISGNNLASADITILSTTTSAITSIIGDYQTAVVDSGVYQVIFSKTGYISDTLSILLDHGIMTTLNAQLFLIGSGCTDPLACNYDSVATINDSSCVYPVMFQQSFSLCYGDSLIVGGSVYAIAGSYIDTLQTVNGCDSIVYTNISIISPSGWQWGTTICYGDSVIVGNSIYFLAGNYIDTLITVNGCDSIVYTNINTTLPALVNLNVSSYNGYNLSCSGSSDGWIEINLSGGSPPFMYTWNNGQSSSIATNLSAGNYVVDIIDVNNCLIEYTFELIEPPFLSVSISSTDETILLNDGTANAIVIGGVPTYNYNWSNGVTINSNFNLAPGLYTVDVTDSNGCVASNSVTVNAYNSTNLLNFDTNSNKNLSKILDVLGQEVTYRKNTYLFYFYDDGTVEKRIVVE
tara:strand:+ start:14698 stop:17064 length:2367 start_codon:yes stop_codon:yes gene_type:complete